MARSDQYESSAPQQGTEADTQHGYPVEPLQAIEQNIANDSNVQFGYSEGSNQVFDQYPSIYPPIYQCQTPPQATNNSLTPDPSDIAVPSIEQTDFVFNDAGVGDHGLHGLPGPSIQAQDHDSLQCSDIDAVTNWEDPRGLWYNGTHDELCLMHAPCTIHTRHCHLRDGMVAFENQDAAMQAFAEKKTEGYEQCLEERVQSQPYENHLSSTGAVAGTFFEQGSNDEEHGTAFWQGSSGGGSDDGMQGTTDLQQGSEYVLQKTSGMPPESDAMWSQSVQRPRTLLGYGYTTSNRDDNVFGFNNLHNAIIPNQAQQQQLQSYDGDQQETTSQEYLTTVPSTHSMTLPGLHPNQQGGHTTQQMIATEHQSGQALQKATPNQQQETGYDDVFSDPSSFQLYGRLSTPHAHNKRPASEYTPQPGPSKVLRTGNNLSRHN